MARSVVSTTDAPQAIGPYSQAITLDNLVFCSGQIPLTPAGTLAEGDIAVQTRQVLTNLKGLLAASGSSLEDVLKTTVFLVDMADFAAMNAVYAEFFTSAPPARSHRHRKFPHPARPRAGRPAPPSGRQRGTAHTPSR